MKYYASNDEWYPVYTVIEVTKELTNHLAEDFLYLSESEFQECELAEKEFLRCQRLISKRLEAYKKSHA